jgi:uncharacterized protein (TIGR03435 family)
MRVGNQHTERILERALTRHANLSKEYVDAAVDHVWSNLQAHIVKTARWTSLELDSTRVARSSLPWRIAVVAAALVIVVLSTVALQRFVQRPEGPGLPSPDSKVLRNPAEGKALALPQQDSEAFEVASIRRSAPRTNGAAAGARGRGGGEGDALPTCVDGNPQLLPGRFLFPNGTLYRLITLAYGKNCDASLSGGFVSGGPDWVRSDRFNIQAIMPEGSPTYTRAEFSSGNAPKLQRMIQALLADRFKLVVRRETKESAVYNLVVTKPGKLKLVEDQTSPPTTDRPRQGGNGSTVPPRGTLRLTSNTQRSNQLILAATAVPITALINVMQQNQDRLIIDRTRLKGLYDIHLELEANISPDPRPEDMADFFSRALDELGLKLESGRGPVEVLIIEHAEQPTEN